VPGKHFPDRQNPCEAPKTKVVTSKITYADWEVVEMIRENKDFEDL